MSGLLNLTDDELQRRYENECERVQFSADDYYREVERRAQTSHAAAIRKLTAVTVFLAVVTTFVGVATLVLQFMAKH